MHTFLQAKDKELTILKEFEKDLISRGFSKNTGRVYRNDLICLVEEFEKPLKDISPNEIEEYMKRYAIGATKKDSANSKKKGITKSVLSQSRNRSAFTNFFELYLKRKNYVPNRGLKLPKIQKVSEYYTHNEVKLLLKHCSDAREQLIIKLGFYGGFRFSDVISLKSADVNFKENKIKVIGKGNKHTYQMFLPEVFNAIKNYWVEFPKGEFVLNFESKRGEIKRESYANQITKFLMELCIQTELNFKTFHKFRHGCGTWLSAPNPQGLDWKLRKVQMYLRHDDPKTSTKYDHSEMDLRNYFEDPSKRKEVTP